jgi:LacI family transcriptional regulator
MAERITIKDISRQLNIHHSTVSRALRNSSKVKKETKKQIVDYAKKHGYKVNMNALKLRGSVKNVIAVIVPNINHDFFANIISVITDMAYSKGYIVSVFQTNESLELEKKVLDSVIHNNIAGVIASVTMQTTSPDHYEILKKYNIPLVMFDRVIDSMDVPKVETDNYNIVAKIVEDLFLNGRDRIVHISGSDKISVFRNRINGYQYMIKKLGISYNNNYIANNGFTIEEGKLAAKILFSGDSRPNAIICDSHLIMIGFISQLKEMNISVPEDVKIISFGNNPSLSALTPEITYIVQPVTKIAKASFDLITEKIKQPDQTQNNKIVFKAMLN